jgi:hypothetical protein
MVKVERLPGQISGIGFVVPVRFQEPYVGWIADLVNSQMFGHSSTDVAERLLCDWFLQRRDNLSKWGITLADAKKRGYCPVKFRGVKEPKFCNVHQRQPLRIKVYGQPAYRVDELARLGMYGTTREEVVRRGVESQILDNLSHYSAVTEMRSLKIR